MSYQLTCRCAAHHRCSKELSIAVAGSPERVLQVLKSWALYGEGVRSREEHMASQLKHLFLDALKAGELLPMTTLDAMVSSDLSDMAPPFAFKEQGEQQGGNILGKKAPQVSQELHEEMTQRALKGEIPVTTPQQRQRNRGTAGSSYGVPAGLLPALQNGYISPNLAPPAGLRWKHRSGEWVLVPRGG